MGRQAAAMLLRLSLLTTERTPRADLRVEEEGAMKYPSGQEVRLGDKVKLGDDSGGVVVFSIDADEYAPGYPKTQWGYLKRGVMINFPKFGLIHYEETEEDLELIARATAK